MPPEENTTLELRDYLRVIRRRKWIIIVTVIICVAGGFAMTLNRTPSYSAAASVWLREAIADPQFNPLDQSGTSTQDSDRQRNNEIQIMGSPEVHTKVVQTLGRPPATVTFIPLENTDFVTIRSTGHKPKLVADTANAYAQTYIDTRKQLTLARLGDAGDEIQKKIDGLNFTIAAANDDLANNPPAPHVNGRAVDEREISRDSMVTQVQGYATELQSIQLAQTLSQEGGAQISAPANVPSNAVQQSPLPNILAGLIVGLVLGIALAFLREYLDDRIKTKDDLETASGETVIGLIPQLPDWKNRETTQLISVAQPRSPAAEAYRTVRTSVEFLSLDQPIGSLQVTSAMAGEGKTTTLANLAITFARVGQRVIVLCCDLRRPRIHEFFGLTNRVGFTSMLLGDAPASEAIQAVRGDLPIGLVASGPLAPNPAELLASKRAVSVIEELDSQCDLLLIDSPPVIPVTDAQVISGLVDGVLLVGNAGQSTKRDMRRAVELLHQVDAPLIGSILNGVSAKHDSAYNYGDNRYYIDQTVSTNGKSDRRNGGKRSKRATVPKKSVL